MASIPRTGAVYRAEAYRRPDVCRLALAALAALLLAAGTVTAAGWAR